MSVRQRVERIEAAVAARERVPLVAVVLELEAGPAWTEPLDAGHVVRLIGGTAAERKKLLEAWRQHPETPPERLIVLPVRPVASEFAVQIVAGPARETLCVGARGDRKTSTVAKASLAHADVHRAAGFPVPVHWMVVGETAISLRENLWDQTLTAPWWGGLWSLRDEGRLAVATIGGVEVVLLHLKGLEDSQATNRVRTEAHALWFEEPAQATTLGVAGGLTFDAFGVAQTSLRLASHHRPSILTSNYPDTDHWIWQRYVVDRHPGTAVVRIPPGESASAAQRAEWREALAGRPDLIKRLLDGEPGSVPLGQQVAEGFREDLHVATEPLVPTAEVPLVIGLDFGLTPCAVIGQNVRGRLRIYASLVCERGGIKQFFANEVIPWLRAHAPWAQGEMLRGGYDPSGEYGEASDIEQTALGQVEQMVGGFWTAGPREWDQRRHILLSALNQHQAPGVPAVQIDPSCHWLIRAYSSKWHYPMERLGGVSRDQPKKPNHPFDDVGDASIYFFAEAAMMASWTLTPQEIRVESAFDPRALFGGGGLESQIWSGGQRLA